ncbi:MAG TPA: hypothetical protein PLX39_17240 [Pyrinomonadaceae bacterium]|nr:hypothetical protein [Pyrinomonadaceae bacterium]
MKISWSGAAVWYACVQTDLVSSAALPVEVAPVECKILPKSSPAHFFEIEGDATVGDEEIDLEIWDGGSLDPATNTFSGKGDFADLVQANGEGTACEVFLWFPAEELLLSVWQGHLRNSEDSDEFIWSGKIANGFRSPDLPLPRRAHWRTCQAIYGGLLTDIDEIAANDCPVDAHLPGGTVGNDDFATCPRQEPQNCVDRGISGNFHLSHRSVEITVRNNQTSGPQLNSISRGNESNLKEPLRVVMGVRRVRDMEVMAFRRDYNNNNPEQGFFNAMYEIGEGPIQSILYPAVNGQYAVGNHYAYRLGTRGQAVIDSSGNALTSHAYSGTAFFRQNYGYVNPASVGPDNMRGTAVVFGLSDVRVYSDEETFTEEWTHNRAWHIARMLCDRRWGLGLDYARLGIDSWIEAAEFGDEWVTFTDPEGTEYEFWRGISDVELVSRSAQQQIEDMCLAGRLSRPYLFQGKVHVSPLRSLSAPELAAAPVFSDNHTANTRKIIWENRDGVERSTLTRSEKSDLDLPNRIECSYHDSTKDWTEATAPPAEDIEQQLKAGRVMGDTSRRVVTKKYSLLGVVQEGHAVSMAHWLMKFGEFGEGGTANNLRIKFKAWILDTLDLHQTKVIKVVSDQLTRYGFDYFRIIKIRRMSDLHVEITAQAHNNDDLDDFDVVGTGPVDDPPVDDPPIDPPCLLQFGSVTWSDGVMLIPIDPC